MRLRITLTDILLAGLTFTLGAISCVIWLIATTSWTMNRPHVATRSFGFAVQQIDRDSITGDEVRILEFPCPSDLSRRYSFNQVSPSELLLVTCSNEQTVTTIPWWFPLTFGNEPILPFKAERSDESLHWRDRA